MTPETRFMITLAGTPVLNVALHMAAARVFRGSARQVVAVKSILIGYVVMFGLLWPPLDAFPTRSGSAAALLYGLLVYTALSYTYFHFFNMSETARRIKILYDIHRAGSLSSGEMSQSYTTADIITVRLQRLVSMGQLRHQDGQYSLGGRTLYWGALAVLVWRKILGFSRGAG